MALEGSSRLVREYVPPEPLDGCEPLDGSAGAQPAAPVSLLAFSEARPAQHLHCYLPAAFQAEEKVARYTMFNINHSVLISIP
jgi:hypothetical protein